MARFVAPNDQGHEPWCRWDNNKKDRVFARLAKIINDNKRIGVGVALPKTVYDAVPQRIRDHYGTQHYTFAVRMRMIQIFQWREQSGIALPMHYVFDWEEPGTSKHREISELMTNVHPSIRPMFGLDTGGFSFRRRQEAKPLQAADILAWQMNAYMPKVYPKGETKADLDKIHPGFRLLREDQEVILGFYAPANIQTWLDRVLQFEETHGVIP
jgi:hypothetical protein